MTHDDARESIPRCPCVADCPQRAGIQVVASGASDLCFFRRFRVPPDIKIAIFAFPGFSPPCRSTGKGGAYLCTRNGSIRHLPHFIPGMRGSFIRTTNRSSPARTAPSANACRPCSTQDAAALAPRLPEPELAWLDRPGVRDCFPARRDAPRGRPGRAATPVPAVVWGSSP